MMRARRRMYVLLAARFSTLFFPTVWATGAIAQQELRPYRQVAYESGHGTATVKRGPSGSYYALNRLDRCVWMFSSSGSMTGRLGSIGMGPADLLSPKDVAVDQEGNALVADGSNTVKVFSPKGQLLTSVPFQRPEHLAVTADGEVLVSGFPKEYLIYRFDRHGRELGSFGMPVKVDDDPFFNAVLNMGTIAVDSKNNIYYVFRYLLTPTVRKYKADGTLLGEWHLTDGDVLAQILGVAKQKYQDNKKASNYGGVPILTAASFDEDSNTLWVASGPQVTELDSSGHTLLTIKLARPDGKPLQAEGIIVQRDTFLASGYLSGIFEYPKPH